MMAYLNLAFAHLPGDNLQHFSRLWVLNLPEFTWELIIKYLLGFVTKKEAKVGDVYQRRTDNNPKGRN